MKESIFGFLLAGVFLGCLLGLVCGLLSLPAVDSVLFLLGSTGAHSVAGGLLGVFMGLVHPTIPENLHFLNQINAAGRHLLPKVDDSLQGRCQASSTIWVTTAILALLTVLISSGYLHLLTRIQSAEFAALGASLFGLFMVAIGLAVTAPLQSVLARIAENAVRRNPNLTLMVHPLLNLLVSILVVGLMVLASSSASDRIWSQVPWGPLSFMIVLFLFTALLGEWLGTHLVRISLGQCIQLSVLAVFFVGVCLHAGLRTEASCQSLARSTGINQAVIGLFRAPFDADGDGFARILGGGDCNDQDPNIHPDAVDILGNTVDENCDGNLLIEPPGEKTTDEEVISFESMGFRPPYSLVLVTVEALRADHVGFYGYGRETTPAIDDLASESVVFRNNYATSSAMPASVASLLSGRYPSELDRDQDEFTRFGADNVFVAEVLNQKGYHTAAFLSHWYFESTSGLEQGFTHWQPYEVERGRLPFVPTAETVVTSAVEYLSRLEPDPTRPFFLWLHIVDPLPNYLNHLDIPPFGTAPVDRYDHEIRYVDTWLEWFFETLRERQDWSRTVVVFAGNRGESFSRESQPGLSEANLRIPLMIRIPGLMARPVEARTSSIDVVPTLLDLAGIENLSSLRVAMNLRGESLIPYCLGRKAPTRPIFAECPRSESEGMHLAWLEGSTKLVFDGRRNRWSVFNITRDPDEQDDLSAGRPALNMRLRTSMKRFRSNLSMRPGRRK